MHAVQLVRICTWHLLAPRSVMAALFLFFHGVLAATVLAQTIQWTRQFGGLSADRVLGVAVAGTSAYIGGYTSGTLPGQTRGGGPAEDAFARHYDVNGNVVWTRQFGTRSREAILAVAVDSTGVYAAGYTTGTLPAQTNVGGWDAFVRKYDSSGNEMWTRQFGSISDDQASGIAIDTTGVYVVGESGNPLPGQAQNFSGRTDAFIRKYDPMGTEVWTRQFGSAEIDSAIGVASDGIAVYVVGETTSSLPGQTGNGDYDAFVRKYDAAGTEGWTRQFGTSSGDEAFAVAADASGIYVGGTTGGALPGQNSAGFFDAFVRKYSSAGIEQWTRQFGSSGIDIVTGAAVDSTGVYAVGNVSGALPGQVAAGGSDAFTRKYDTAGSEVWTTQFGSSSEDRAAAVAANFSGVYVAGYTSGVLPGQTVSPGPISEDEIPSLEDAFVVKLTGPSPPPKRRAVRR